ncbi:MAG TPA: efflux RND transporter periplasmic adaptor subunit [Polyangiales bacterium]|jgi:membrane fusion protein (multidrug efflux system)|nr:efflux RND transporter periplasmic adaptor subunit [Polyangiales bacterium]
MAKKIILTALGLIVVVGALAGIKVMQFQAMSASAATAGPPPESVAVSEVKEVMWQPTIDAVGTITAVQGVTLSAEVPGTIKRIAFESGQIVKAGEVLVELDIVTERAQLQAAEANADLARTNLERDTSLEKSGSIAANQVKTSAATSKQSEAELARLKSIISKKTIRAPFSGRTGIRMVNLGQFVGNGDAIVSLQSPDPVYVDFSLPQQRLSDLTEGLEVRVVTDSFPNEEFNGKVAAIQPELDAVTRNVKLRGELQNPKGQLRPGMFVRAQVVLPNSDKVVVVPATSIMYAPYGDSVFVVGPPQAKEKAAASDSEKAADKDKAADGKSAAAEKPADPNALVAEQKFVRLGATRGDFVAITKGLKPGEKVVVTGAFKLRNGAAVVINNALLPNLSETPKPNDT